MKKYYSLVTVLVLALSVFSAANVAWAADAGDVIINEFSSASETEWVELMNTTDDPIDLEGWKLTEFTSPQDAPEEVDLLELSGTLPAEGLLVFEVDGLNNPGDSIGLYDDSDTLLHRVTYGTVAGVEETDVDAPNGEESAQFDSDSEEDPWYLNDPTKGWFNDAGEEGKAPLLQDLDLGEDIDSNIGDLDNPSATPDNEEAGALYFGTEDGRVVFEQQLNLTDQAVVELLNNLADMMSMSWPEEESFSPVIYFDSELADALAAAGARIYMFSVGGLESQFEVIVKNDDGEVIDPDDEDYPEISDQAYEEGTVSFVVSHFSQFEVDLPVTNETTGEKYPTIRSALDEEEANDGDTIRVASGTYEEGELEIWQNGLTLAGDVGDEEVGPGDNAPVVVGDCDYGLTVYASDVVVEGFRFYQGGLEEYCYSYPVIRIIGGEEEEDTTNVTINENEIVGGYRGVQIRDDAYGNTISDNKIHNNSSGVSISGSPENSISGNEIYENGDGIVLREGSCDDECTGDVSGTEIIGNYIHDNDEETSGIHVGEVSFSELTISDNTIADNGGYGIYFDRVSEGELTISGNEITGNSAAGVYISGRSGTISASTVMLENNTISDNSYEGVYISQVDNESTLDIIGNTITDNGVDEEDEGDDYAGVYINNVFDSAVTFEDNIVSDNAGPGVYLCSEGECSSSTLTFQGNMIEDNNSSGIYLYYVYNSTVLIDNNNISDNEDKGIYVNEIYEGQEEEVPGESLLTITNNTIANNGNEDTGIYLEEVEEGVEVAINFNAITGNGTGLFVDDVVDNEEIEGEPGPVNATNNWWGDASGPENEENEGGEGDEAEGNVIFSPWLAALGLSGNNPIVGQITNSNDEAVGGDTGVKIKFEAEGDNPAETATEEIDSNDQALYEVDIDGPNAGLTTVTGMALFANQDSTLTSELEIIGIEEEEEEDDGGGISSSGSRARPRGTTTLGSAGEEEGEVLGEEKFVFTLFLKKGPPYNLSVQGNEVMELQKLLNSLGFGPLAVDGKYGPLTEAAVKAFQAAHPPLVVDGIVGPLTRAVLNSL